MKAEFFSPARTWAGNEEVADSGRRRRADV